MPVYVGRISQAKNYMTMSKEWAIIGPPWCVIVLNLLEGAMHANYMLTSFIKLRSHYTQLLHPSLSRRRGWMS